MEWMVSKGYFGWDNKSSFRSSTSDLDLAAQLDHQIEAKLEKGQEEEEEEVDLDDSLAAILVEVGVEAVIASIILPYIFVWFWPRIRGIIRIAESSVE